VSRIAGPVSPTKPAGVTYEAIRQGDGRLAIGVKFTSGATDRLSYEGFAIYPNGIIYFGDEQRPGNGVIGGATSSSSP
jgi:hypothetical protein